MACPSETVFCPLTNSFVLWRNMRTPSACTHARRLQVAESTRLSFATNAHGYSSNKRIHEDLEIFRGPVIKSFDSKWFVRRVPYFGNKKRHLCLPRADQSRWRFAEITTNQQGSRCCTSKSNTSTERTVSINLRLSRGFPCVIQRKEARPASTMDVLSKCHFLAGRRGLQPMWSSHSGFVTQTANQPNVCRRKYCCLWQKSLICALHGPRPRCKIHQRKHMRNRRYKYSLVQRFWPAVGVADLVDGPTVWGEVVWGGVYCLGLSVS